MGKRILVLYTPHSVQLAFHNSTKRYRVCSLGRQSGKSTMCINELLKRAWCNPGQKLWFISPTYDQAKIQYRRTMGMLFASPEIVLKKNQSELRIKLMNQSEIIFKSGESFDNMRGSTLNGVVIDEVRDQHPDLWPMVIRPMLTTTGGWAAFVSTPNGFDAFYDLFKKGEESPEDWEVFKSPSTCNPLFTREEYNKLKSELPEPYFKQEIEADFLNLHSGSVYVNHGPHNQTFVSPFCKDGSLISPHLPIVVGMDFNVGLMVWELMQHNNCMFYCFDELAVKSTHTQEMAKVLIEKVRHHKPGIVLIGDATGGARNTKSAGETDYTILEIALREAGINYRNETPTHNPLVKDRVNTMNGRLRAADGTVHFFYHPKNCPYLNKDLERVSWKQNATNAILDQVTDRTLTHASDAAGYPVMRLTEMVVNRAGVTRVVRR